MRYLPRVLPSTRESSRAFSISSPISARKPSFVFIVASCLAADGVRRDCRLKVHSGKTVFLETAYFSSKRRFCQAKLTEAPLFWLVSAVLFLTDQELGGPLRFGHQLLHDAFHPHAAGTFDKQEVALMQALLQEASRFRSV